MSGAPRTFGLVGWPVEHSLSPALQRAAFREMGLDAVYVSLPVREGELSAVLRVLARAGGGNVTAPHKRRAASLLDRPSEAVRDTGACNCFWGEDGELRGDNTDVGGFLRAVRGWEDVRLQEARVLLLGAGGAARAVLAACAAGGARRVEVLNRTVERARELVEELDTASLSTRVLESPEEADGRQYEIAVNATSLGLRPEDPLPLDPGRVEAAVAFDLVYGEGGTAWTREARRRGIPARDGKGMLIEQAALSLERWTGAEAPRAAMREVLEGGSVDGRK